MAEWQVGPHFLHLSPHPNAENLQLATVGDYQIVIGKDTMHSEDDLVVFAPERSILPEDLKGNYVNKDTGSSYLSGPNKDRVTRVRLRGEYSEGVIIPWAWVQEKLDGNIPEFHADWSEALGITKYEPPIPPSLQGKVARFNGPLHPIGGGNSLRQHDVETFRIYQREFNAGEEVVVTEKIHGCVISSTRVRMANGNDSKPIKALVPGDEVLGVDQDGLLVSSTVNAVQRGAKTEDWVKIGVDPANCGSGSSYFNVVCTPNHPFWIPSRGEYVAAQDLIVGMDVLRLNYGPESDVHRIVSIEKVYPSDMHRWDIQTETKNFFANGILVHNSQLTIVRDAAGSRWVTSKGHAKRQSVILDEPGNTYWQATRNTGIFDILDGIEELQGHGVQMWGEVFPVQRGFTYGAVEPTLLLFRVAVDNVDLGFAEVRARLASLLPLWVPLLHEGPYDPEAVAAFAPGKETVSGKALHIREGVVLIPKHPRRIKRTGAYLALKLISPAYKDKEEAIS